MQRGRALLLIAFGALDSAALPYGDVQKEASAHYPQESIKWSYTSNSIRSRLANRGIIVPTIEENILSLAKEGLKTLDIQPLHIVEGEEFLGIRAEIIRILSERPNLFDHVYLGRPLLDSEADIESATHEVLAAFPVERQQNEGILFVAHGNHKEIGDKPLDVLAETFQKEDPLVYLATLSGKTGLNLIIPELKKNGIKTLWLSPFLITTGNHARNDLAGEHDESWAKRLSNEGFDIKFNLHGIAEIPGIRAIFLRHALEAKDDLIRAFQ